MAIKRPAKVWGEGGCLSDEIGNLVGPAERRYNNEASAATRKFRQVRGPRVGRFITL
jgi:hypothetical protein